ncbi:hypothetical protein BDZ91DRAFT_850453 [Kalaharituber pfeilii]|nr:hypothetical protein BDZ91DRAFT_850453 [Kalaharituber pfeilii]
MEIAVHSEKETSQVNSSMLNSMAAHEYHSSAVASSRTVWQHSRSTAARIHPRMAAFTQHDSKNTSLMAAFTQHCSKHLRSMAAFAQHGSIQRSTAAFAQHGSTHAAWQHSRSMAAFTQHGSIRVLWQPTRRMHDSIDVA